MAAALRRPGGMRVGGGGGGGGGGGREREAALLLVLIAVACGFVVVLLNLPDGRALPGGVPGERWNLLGLFVRSSSSAAADADDSRFL